MKPVYKWFQQRLGVNPEAIRQAVEYLAAAGKSLGTLPTQRRIVLERFFDEAGDLHLIIHSPYGSRINRAWGLALRKRFCRRFNFELQAAATEDALLLSLGSGQSFPLETVKDFLSSESVRDLLIQAVLDNPMFTARWRWNATISLAVRRFRHGHRTPPYLIRMEAEDLVTAVFPDQLACLENIQGDREIPDHPLVKQTLDDCLFEAMDIAGLERILVGIQSGEIEVLARETVEPSPLSAEMVGARIYAFLDGAPLEERRVRAVSQRRWLDPENANDLARLDPRAIAQIRQEARPNPRNTEEMHDALLCGGYIPLAECNPEWLGFLDNLAVQGRAMKIGEKLWIATENWPRWQAVRPDLAKATCPEPRLPTDLTEASWERGNALAAILRDRLTQTGPVTPKTLVGETGIGFDDIEQALLRLEQEGSILRGEFGWCERTLLARIHRLTLNTLRAAIEPVSHAGFMRFLLRWQHLHPDTRLEGSAGLEEILDQLEGTEATVEQWERSILPGRMVKYDSTWLDRLCLSGRYRWLRLTPSGRLTPPRRIPVAFIPRRHLRDWLESGGNNAPRSPLGEKTLEILERQGALFFDELLEDCRLLPSQLESALAELVALGLVSADSYDGLRSLLLPEAKKRRHKRVLSSLENAGRWHCLTSSRENDEEDTAEHRARCLLRRYGIVFRAIAAREAAMPSWLQLVRIYRRMEARGEIRGGRFIAGQFGEQFALPEAVTMLRQADKRTEDGTVTITVSDPVNLLPLLDSTATGSAVKEEILHLVSGIPASRPPGSKTAWH